MCDKCKDVAVPDYEKIMGEARAELARVKRWEFASNALSVGAVVLAVASLVETDPLSFYKGVMPALGMYLAAQVCFIKYQRRIIKHALMTVSGLSDLLLQIGKDRLFRSIIRPGSVEAGQLN